MLHAVSQQIEKVVKICGEEYLTKETLKKNNKLHSLLLAD